MDRKNIDFERFFEASTPQTCSGIKNHDMDIIYNISDQEKISKIFNSKIRLRGEHDLSRESITFREMSAITLTV